MLREISLLNYGMCQAMIVTKTAGLFSIHKLMVITEFPSFHKCHILLIANCVCQNDSNLKRERSPKRTCVCET